MISYRTEIKQSWVNTEPSSRALAQLLGMTTPTTLRDIVNRLRVVETIVLKKDIHTPDSTPITGHVSMTLKSDGNYVFSGWVKATGVPSYHFGLQAWVDALGSLPVTSTRSGDVYGHDTQGSDTYNWTEPGNNGGIKESWRSLRTAPVLHFSFKADISGLLGGALDVLKFAVKGIVTSAVLGPAGWYVLIGNELAGASNDLASPDITAGIMVGAGVLLVVGPFGLVPAVVAGAATVAIADVKHHTMKPEEIAFARKVYGDSLPYDDIVLTNLQRPDGRKFAWPGVGNKILLNLGPTAYQNPLTYTEPDTYPGQGQVFIHELAHAWQIANLGLVRVVCNLSDDDYTYADDPTWSTRAFASFNNEEQASIVDQWFWRHSANLNSLNALQDPAFHFVRDNIRAGLG